MFSCRAQTAFVLVVVLLGSLSMLQSCGQTGDLYLPEPEAAPPAEAPAGDADVPPASAPTPAQQNNNNNGDV